MTLSLRISRAGLALIKSFEGYRERATRLPDGRWVIGHGHVKSAREGVRVSPEDAEALLVYDLKPIEQAFEDLLFSPLNQNQHDALVSFVFNISLGLFRDSDVLHRLNTGDHLGAANALEAWRKARINGQVCVVDALVRRRAIEKALFLEHPDGRATAATPLVAPQIDRGLIEGLSANKVSPIAPQPPREDDVAGMTSAIERLIATGSINPESAGNTLDIDALLNRKADKGEAFSDATTAKAEQDLEKDTNLDAFKVDFIGENDANDFSKYANEKDIDSQEAELDENEIVFIGETDEDVFSAIGAEVDDALNTSEASSDPVVDTLPKEVETTHERIRSVALASEKVERLVANDVLPDQDNEQSTDFEAAKDTASEFDILSDDDAIIGSLKIDPDTTDADAAESQETPEEVILSLLEESVEKEDQTPSSTSKTPQEAADAVAKRLESIFEPDLLTLTEKVNDKVPVVDDVEGSTQDAWNLSQGLTQDQEELSVFDDDRKAETLNPKKRAKTDVEAAAKEELQTGYGYAENSIPKDPRFDALEEETAYDIPQNELDNAEASRSDGRLWIGVMFASIAVIVLGVLDFYRKAQPGKIVNQSDIAFGPLMIAIGGLIFLMAAYFLVSRRGK
ncbi:lysozyme [Hirschia litorea]|uniref:Lysozyme n=1 Tax=Hirschia litorea TaxID=1199156 RepID=A0ABW2IG62_9PROT